MFIKKAAHSFDIGHFFEKVIAARRLCLIWGGIQSLLLFLEARKKKHFAFCLKINLSCKLCLFGSHLPQLIFQRAALPEVRFHLWLNGCRKSVRMDGKGRCRKNGDTSGEMNVKINLTDVQIRREA